MLRRSKQPGERRDPPPDALVVGLGNPGDDYAGTRHNVGFEVVEALAGRFGGTWRAVRQRARLCEVRAPEGRIALAEPQTYMNESGGSVQALVRHLGVELDRLCVCHDDLDLDFGVLRLKAGGGTAGHQGVNSVARAVGSKEFVRLRIGIGRPPGRQDPADFVLRRFTRAEREEMDVVVARAADLVLHWITDGVESAQNRFH